MQPPVAHLRYRLLKVCAAAAYVAAVRTRVAAGASRVGRIHLRSQTMSNPNSRCAAEQMSSSEAVHLVPESQGLCGRAPHERLFLGRQTR